MVSLGEANCAVAQFSTELPDLNQENNVGMRGAFLPF